MAMAENLSACPRSYDEIDASRWRISGVEVLGTKPKRWLVKPYTDERWLMKDATFNTSREGLTYRKGDDWAERVAYGVAGAMGLPVARVELCVRSSSEQIVYGTICRSVLDVGQDLVHGNALLAEQDVFVTSRDRGPYTVEAIHGALEGCQLPAGTLGGASAWKVFVGYLVLDALIGNTDRHDKNWAAIVSDSGSVLAPTFDHASSLGFLLSDREKRERLLSKDRNYTPEAFADRAKTRFAGKPHPIAAVTETRSLDGGGAADY